MLEKPETQAEELTDDKDVEIDAKEQDGDKERDDKTEENTPKDEDMLKVIRYLVAAGCDVNLPVGIIF